MKEFLLYKLIQLVSSNLILYKIWFYIIRSRVGDRVRLPKESDDLYFDGFPRSSNTYLQGLIKFIYPSLSFASHLHSVPAIKIAQTMKLPIFIVIREPFGSISSFYFTKTDGGRNKKSSRIIIQRYCKYYKYLLKNYTDINFIIFPDWLKKKKATVEKVVKPIMGFDVKGIDNNRFLEFDNLMWKLEKKKGLGASLPSEEKNRFKESVKLEIVNNSEYKYADALYKELIESINSNK